jgi:hypothetical protein
MPWCAAQLMALSFLFPIQCGAASAKKEVVQGKVKARTRLVSDPFAMNIELRRYFHERGGS